MYAPPKPFSGADLGAQPSLCMAKFATLPLSYLRRNIDIVRRSIIRTEQDKERHMSLIEDREGQQLYHEIVRQPEPRCTP